MHITTNYYLDDKGNIVFTKQYLLKRGKCCSSGCRHCPYKTNKNDELTKNNKNY